MGWERTDIDTRAGEAPLAARPPVAIPQHCHRTHKMCPGLPSTQQKAPAQLRILSL